MIGIPFLLNKLIKKGYLNRRRWVTFMLTIPVGFLTMYTLWDFMSYGNISRTFWLIFFLGFSDIFDSFDFMLSLGFLNIISDEVIYIFIIVEYWRNLLHYSC